MKNSVWNYWVWLGKSKLKNEISLDTLKFKKNLKKTKQQQKNTQIILNAGDDLEQVNFCTFLIGMENWDSFSEGWWFIKVNCTLTKHIYPEVPLYREKKTCIYTKIYYQTFRAVLTVKFWKQPRVLHPKNE